MHCGSCGAEVIPGKPFCHACGTRVATRCRSCGAALDPTFRFCPDCGAAVDDAAVPAAGAAVPAAATDRAARQIPPGVAEKIRASRGAIEGERKLVTVLFCDLVGSTAIAERLDPEEYHELLDQYLERAFRAIYAVDGLVNQLAGDGMMALFGAPIAHEDAPRRAVQAALGIQEALGPLAARVEAERGIRLEARIGINTGPVVVGGIGNDLKMDYSAIGDTTNLAARLEALADPGTILISESTHRLVRGFFRVRPTGPLDVKGKSDPVSAYEVLGPTEAATSMSVAEERGLTPFVAREDDLAQLEGAFRRLAAGQPQMVTVVGEAGRGKSRLLYEFKRRLEGAPVIFFDGHCSAMSQATPYQPFVTMLRAFFGLVPGEAPAAARDKVAAKLGDHAEGKLERRFPLLGRFMAGAATGPEELSPEQLKRESFEAMAGLVSKASAQAPVVVTIEDVQWIDDSSRELLESLIARLERMRVMVLLTHRPHDHPGWRTPAALTQIVLRRLSDGDVAAMIRSIAGGTLPTELQDRLVAKAEGSPFFSEEMTRALLEEGHLVCDGGRCRLTRPVAEIPIPGTVQEVIAARLDRLQPHAKRAVQVAAVLGRQFSRDELVSLLEDEHIDVGPALAELERRGLLHRKNLLSSDAYRFGESVTQEVAYESLLLRQRRLLHERVGLLLEASGNGNAGAERSAVVAHHFERSDNRAKALEALVRAGRDAAELPSYHTAAQFFRRACRLARDLPEDAPEDQRRLALEAISTLGGLVIAFGLPYENEAREAAELGRVLAEALGDVEALSNLTYLQGVMLMTHEPEQFARGLALAEEAMAVAEREGMIVQAIRVARGICLHYAFDGRTELALRAIDWAVGELEKSGQHGSDLDLAARWVRGVVLYVADDLEAARAAAAEIYDLAFSAPNRTMQGASALLRASVHFVRGEYAEAKRWADRSLEVNEEIANRAALPPAAAIALMARHELGEPAGDGRYLQAIEDGLGVTSITQMNLLLVGEALLRHGEVAQADRYARLLRQRGGGRLRAAHVATVHGTVLGRLGRHEEAERVFREAMALAESIGARSALALATLRAAELGTARGGTFVSPQQMEHALATFRALGLGRYVAPAARLVGGSSAQLDRGAPVA